MTWSCLLGLGAYWKGRSEQQADEDIYKLSVGINHCSGPLQCDKSDEAVLLRVTDSESRESHVSQQLKVGLRQNSTYQ